MLSDQDILAELIAHSGGEGSGLRIAPFPREQNVDWSSLPLSDPQWNGNESPIQPASIDLHVGHIYVPGQPDGSIGSEGHGATSHTLRPGHSVIVSTYESITLPASLGGIVFPPSALSSSGILVANLGHIDPGFTGHLRFTVINMGGSDFPLERGKAAVGTLLLFRLDQSSQAPWSKRHEGMPSKGEPDKKEIDALAKDFADIQSRVARITRRAVNRYQWRFSLWAVLVPIVLGIWLGVWTVDVETGRRFADRIEKDDQSIVEIKGKLNRLEATAEPGLEETNRELEHMRTDLERYRADLSEIRDRVGSKSTPAPAKQ
jgi:deoxycytidine triphosphate deaminase